jgi:hypothetical protein
VPGQSVNLLRLLRPEHVSVGFCDQAWPLEATSALDWLGAIAVDLETLAGVFPGLIGDDRLDDMINLIVEDPARMLNWLPVAQEVVGAAAGRDWWWAVNLTRKATSSWPLINGFLIRQGVRADGIGFPDWLDACYSWLWEHCDEEERIKLDLQLSMRPKGVAIKQSKAQVQAMLADFAAD